jgi:hypothetical protein
VTRAYDSVFGGVRASALVPRTSFRQGSNEVELYAVLERVGHPVLRPLGGTGS